VVKIYPFPQHLSSIFPLIHGSGIFPAFGGNETKLSNQPIYPSMPLAGTGAELEYRVIAVNKSGEGSPSNTVMPDRRIKKNKYPDMSGL
jgi:hypothetical protein